MNRPILAKVNGTFARMRLDHILWRCRVKRTALIVAGIALLALLLVGGAYMAGRLLGLGIGDLGADDGPKVMIGTGDGPVVEADWVKAEELPESSPDVVGVYDGRQDNSIFVDETEGGFVVAKGEDDTFSVANTNGKTSEVVVTSETAVFVDETQEDIDAALYDGKLHQQVAPGLVDEIGELSFVRAWGEMRGDRLVASVLVYSLPPVISR
jgi:hypothetical protein